MTTEQTASTPPLVEGDVEFVRVESGQILVELPPRRKYTAGRLLELHDLVAGHANGLSGNEVRTTDSGFVLVYSHRDARDGGTAAAALRRRLVATLKPHYTTVAMVGGVVDRAHRIHVGTTITFEFTSIHDRPTVDEAEMKAKVAGVYRVASTINSISVGMAEPTLDDDAARTFAATIAEFLRVRLDKPMFTLEDDDPNARMYDAFSFDPASREATE